MTHKPTVLIVDDDHELRESLRNALETGGYDVAEAQDAEAALEELKKSSFNLVLLDLHLPGPSGLEVLRQIKETNQHIRVLMITAYPSSDSAIEALNKAAFAYLEKPLDMTKLMTKLSRALAQQQEELFMIKPLSARLEKH
mgnify:CR=1 FL=1